MGQQKVMDGEKLVHPGKEPLLRMHFVLGLISLYQFVSKNLLKFNETSWDELSSHQAEADSLNLTSSYGYVTTQF